YPERTLITTGLSKWCGAGGWRLGVQIVPADAPEALKKALIGLASETFSSAATPIQVAAIQAYVRDNETETYLRLQCDLLREIGIQVHRKLADAGIAVHPPEGAFYLLLDFSPLQDILKSRGITTDEQLCEQILRDTGVALLPGIAFGLPVEALTARLSYVDFNGTSLLDAMKHTDDTSTVIQQNCSHMFEGISRLVSWLQ
ncbi:MAG: aminotransferase class I/II-fold pyridoxal phosphate-dependent enzyme, partial [Aggregatilineales bacterium]